MSKRADRSGGTSLVAGVRPSGACTELRLATGERCVVPARPDPASARRLRLGFAHLGSVRIDLVPGQPRASVLGAARHLPVRRSVPLATALSLAVAGVPTSVHRPGGAPVTIPAEAAR